MSYLWNVIFYIYIYIFLKIQEMGNLDNYLTRFISSNVGN